MYLRTLENSVKKATQRRKGTRQVKENPVMYCSGSSTNKESLVHSCVSDTVVSSASLSQTNQIDAFDTFIVQKVNPRTDSENATNYSQSFLPTLTRFPRSNQSSMSILTITPLL